MKVVTDLSVTSYPYGQREQWSPSSLFSGGGVVGAWYDPSDQTTLFQDAAATIPVTASGQPVGCVLDKSGNGRNATQSVSSSRPIYHAVGTRHWLEFDGVDDRMQITPSLNLNAGTIALALVEPPGRTTTAGVISSSAAGYIAIFGSGASRTLGKNDSSVISPVDTPARFPMTDESAIGIRVAGGTLNARRWPDPTEFHNSVGATANLTYANTLMAFSAGGALAASGKLHGALLFEASLPQADLDRCLAFLNRKVAP